MTAITLAYAHPYQATCLARHIPAVKHENFRLPKLKARYPYLLNARSTTRVRGNDFRGWATDTDGGTRVENGEPSLGGVSLHGFTMEELISCLVLFSPPRLIPLCLEPELIPVTLLRCLLCLM